MLRKSPAPFFLISVALLVASGCSSGSSAGKAMPGWLGGSAGAAKPSGRTLYAAEAGLPVRSKPDFSSEAVGSLRLHEKVVQTGEEKGFAKVSARGGVLKGWVPSSKLVRSATASSSNKDAADAGADESLPQVSDSEAAGAESETPAPEETAADAAGPAAAEPAPGPERPRGVGASVFDPY